MHRIPPGRLRFSGACLSLCLVFTIAGCGPDADAPLALRIEDARNRIAEEAGELWPGFEPETVPLLIYAADTSWLAGMESAPEGFTLYPHEENLYYQAGRYGNLTANTTIELAGQPVATLLLDQSRRDTLPELAALAMHESFHVFHQRRFPEWRANEADLFLYPATDPDLLGWQIMEMEGLHSAVRSLARGEEDSALAAAGVAVAARAHFDEFAPPFASEYVRLTELNEGLAQYIELVAAGTGGPREIPDNAYAADGIRHRGYFTGAMTALLLDTYQPNWKERIDDMMLVPGLEGERVDAAVSSSDPERMDEEDEPVSLASLLEHAIRREGSLPAELPDDVWTEALRRANLRIRIHRGNLRDELSAFERSPGYSLTIEADEDPFWAAGFDPLNVLRLDDNRVLHTRWLRVTGSPGNGEVLGRTVLTEPDGNHPLFEGFHRLVLTGLDVPPRADWSGDSLYISFEGGSFALANASIEDHEGEMRIIIESGKNRSLD